MTSTLLLSLSLALAPQLAPTPEDIERGAFGVGQIQVADLDGDGRRDLVVPSTEEGRIVWFQGIGMTSLEFGRPVTVADGLDDVDSLAVGDIDGDGTQDVFVALGGAVTWLKGLGGGALGPPQVIDGAAPGATQILAADFNGDGVLDLAALLEGFSTPSVWFGTSAGSFQPRMQLGAHVDVSGMVALGLRAADLNGDGAVDLLTWHLGGNSIQVHQPTTAGAFASPFLVGGEVNDVVRGIDAGDVDNDGDLDLVILRTGRIYVYLNDGLSTLNFHWLSGSGFDLNSLIRLADVNADGWLDVLFSSRRHDLNVELGDGSGAFTGFSPWTISVGIGNAFRSIAVLPRAGGGHDLALGTGGLLLVAGEDVLSSSVGADPTIISEPIELSSAAVVDVNGDGWLDLVSSTRFEMQIRYGDGNGGFGQPVDVGIPPKQAEPIAAADFDGDGFGDVVYPVGGPLGTRRLFWRRGSPVGLEPAIEIDPSLPSLMFGEFVSMRAGDADGDGDLDVFVTRVFVGQRSTGFYRLDSGSFEPDFVPVRDGFDLQDLQDVNGDGRVDLLLVRRGSWETVVLASDGQGAAYLPEQILTGPSQEFARFVDVDEDGDLDVIRTDRSQYPTSPANLDWFERTGATYDPMPRLLVSDVGELTSAAFFDLDSDGDQDLLSGTRRAVPGISSFVFELTQVLNDGSGGWSLGSVIDDRFKSAPALLPVDVDRDGNMDILTGGDGNTIIGDFLEYEAVDRVRLYRSIGRVDDPVCGGAQNSTGAVAELEVGGSDRVEENRLVLSVGGLPAGTFTLFALSRSEAFVPGAGGSQGDLCLGGRIGRFVAPGQIQAASPMGRLFLGIDLEALPFAGSASVAMAGERLYFQGWYRDFNPSPTSNFTSARSITLR